MQLGVKPHIFLARLLAVFVVTYAVWIPLAPLYTQMLAGVTRTTLNFTESIAGSPSTVMFVRETQEGRPAIYFRHGHFPQLESGIPAEWVQANLVLLIPLMLAVPALTWRQRFTRLAWALILAVALQVFDIMVTVRALYASYPPTGYGSLLRRIYQFADAFAQAFDTQLFPFVIWAGIHFRQLMGWEEAETKALPVKRHRQAKGVSMARRSRNPK